ncbi:LysR family transcriptional regulator [Paenibacillus sepulcri]|uniref:LysR family transcriptional regulator n=1 Tax=Paenibacillus sepulcri TaxID=359917 RepID=A0ABS7C8X0_9BACL|nr:LysR family transcriptional regulator [Paenibacillus sepulcri]
MEIRMIKTFLAIMQHGSFLKAAEVLQYSQPTVTMHIKKLEQEVGVELLIRGKTIKLTEAGYLFMPKAKKLLLEYENLNDTISDYLHGDGGYVRIGASEPSASHLIPEILSQYKLKFPNVHVSIYIDSASRLKEKLREDQIDFAVCSETDRENGIQYEALLREPMAVLIPDTHPLAKEPSLTVMQLKDAHFLMTMGTCPIRLKVESIIASNFGDQFMGLEIGSITSLKYYVQAGLGVALAPIVAISPPINGTLVKRINDLNTDLTIGILSKLDEQTNRITTTRLINEARRVLLSKNGGLSGQEAI